MANKLQLSRRTFLRGAGVAMGLPFLEGMIPSKMFGAPSTAAPVRMAFVFFPNGASMDSWTPGKVGEGLVLSPTLEPLAKVKQKLTVISGLAQDNARHKGDGAGDHARSAAAFLTGAHPLKSSSTIRAGVSVDQFAAEKIGQLTALPSLEIGTEGGRNSGQCDSGYSCAYSGNISWKSPTTPMAKEIVPKAVFERLFGAQDQRKEQERRNFYRKSILDSVAEDADHLRKGLGKSDRSKLDEYFASIRDLEQRISRATGKSKDVPNLEVPSSIPRDVNVHLELMFDLLALSFQTDTTRIASFMLANEGSNRSYPMIGVNDGHHHLSHHQKKADWIAQIQKIDQYLVTHFARFLEKLDSVRDGEGTLLDNSMIVYGSAIADGNAHAHHDLPIVLAGLGGNTIKGNRHLVMKKETPLNNLFLSMLDRMKVSADSIGDSNGRLTAIDS